MEPKLKPAEQGKLNHATRLSLFDSALESGLSAIKGAMLINGGAAIAVLSFLGAIIKESHINPLLQTRMAYSLLAFALGVAAAGTTLCLRYVCQALFTLEFDYRERAPQKSAKIRSWGNAALYASIAIGLSSLIAFVVGVWGAYSALLIQG